MADTPQQSFHTAASMTTIINNREEAKTLAAVSKPSVLGNSFQIYSKSTSRRVDLSDFNNYKSLLIKDLRSYISFQLGYSRSFGRRKTHATRNRRR